MAVKPQRKRQPVKPPEGFTRMNLNVQTELHQRFKAAAALQGKKMTDVLIDYIRRYVEEKEGAAARRKAKREQ